MPNIGSQGQGKWINKKKPHFWGAKSDCKEVPLACRQMWGAGLRRDSLTLRRQKSPEKVKEHGCKHPQSCYHFLMLPSLSVSNPTDKIPAVPVPRQGRPGAAWVQDTAAQTHWNAAPCSTTSGCSGEQGASESMFSLLLR